MLKLEGFQIAILVHALLDAFPKRCDIESLVTIHLNKNLDQLVARNNLKLEVEELVSKANSNSYLECLLGGALLHNHGNGQLKSFIDSLVSNARQAYPFVSSEKFTRQPTEQETGEFQALLANCPCIGTSDRPPYGILVRLPSCLSVRVAQRYPSICWSRELAYTLGPLDGGIQLLTAIVIELDGDVQSTRKLDEWTKSHVPMRHGELSLYQLTQCVLRLDREDAQVRQFLSQYSDRSHQSYRDYSSSPDAQADDGPTSGSHLLPALIRRLADAQSGSEADPLFQFVADLYRLVPGNGNQQLKRWLHAVGLHDLSSLTVSVRPEVGDCPDCLVVVIAPCPPDGYSAKIWLTNRIGQAHKLFDDCGSSRSLTELAETVKVIRKTVCARGNVAIDQLRVEFVLPRELICSPVEHWRCQVGRTDQPIGVLHPVVIRSYERAYDTSLHDTHAAWQTKWNRLQDPAGLGSDSIRWEFASETEDMDALFARLNDPNTVCVVLKSVPTESPQDVRTDTLEVCIDASVPIVVWRNEMDDKGDTLQQLEHALTLQDLPRLPQWAHERRREAVGQPNRNCLGRDLKLLWDAHDRLPPDVNLQRESVGRRSER